MQDNLPDVPVKEKEEEGIGVGIEGRQKQSWLDKLNQFKGDDKRVMKFMLVGGLGLLVGLGIIVSILEKVQGDRQEDQVDQGEMENILLTIEKKPGEIAFLFFLDENKSNEFEHNEKMFVNISVSVRRPGEPEAFRTEASDDSGQVRIDNLDSGEYEVSFLNYGQEQPRVIGDFELPAFYELADELIPTEFQTIVLEDGGYGEIIGIREYRPRKLLVLTDVLEVIFYDFKRDLIYGRSIIGDKIQRRFLLKDNEVFYIKEKELKKFSFKDKVEVMVMDRLYGVDETKFAVSPEMSTIVFAESDELNYMTKDGHCGDGGIIYEGQRLEIRKEPEILVDFFDEKNFVLVGRVGKEEWEGYRVKCGEKAKFEAEKLEIGETRVIKVLNDKTLFYVSSRGSYFYDFEKKESLKYTALKVPEKVMVSKNRKYIAGLVGGKYIVVDYPAVKATGVEKHYELKVDNLVFNGDEVLVVKGKEVSRILLMGNGVWKEGETMELRDVAVREVLGEIEL